MSNRLGAMEHEVYVPFSVGSVRAALTETERVARCVPGLQRAAETVESAEASGAAGAHASAAGRMTGRLRVRVAGSTITYRGSLTLTPAGEADGAPGAFEQLDVVGNGSESVGEGTAELTLTLAPRSADDGEGTTLLCTGTVTGTGRLAGVEEKAAHAAGVRLLDRFATALADSIRQEPPAGSAEAEGVREGEQGPVTGGIGAPGDNERAIPGIPEPETEPDRTDRTPLFETEIPPSSLGRDDEAEPREGADGTGGSGGPGGPEGPGGLNGAGGTDGTDGLAGLEADAGAYAGREPGDEGYGGPVEPLAAEAAHARRTMIGRSAEEVDHAPPRGRYAPVPAPQPATATATLRWAAPAAAVVVAGAVVLGRVLRRRR